MYTREVAEQIITGLADAKTLRSICRQPGIPSHQTVLRWADQDLDGFAERYRKAREQGYLAMADEVLDLADDSGTEPGEVQKARLRFDARRWLLSKALPKLFGDKLTLAGDPENPLVIEDTRASIETMLAEFQSGRADGAATRGAEAPAEPAPRPKRPLPKRVAELAPKRAKSAEVGFGMDEPEPPPSPEPRRSAVEPVDHLAPFRGNGQIDGPIFND
jgi:hypothetical protein